MRWKFGCVPSTCKCQLSTLVSSPKHAFARPPNTGRNFIERLDFRGEGVARSSTHGIRPPIPQVSVISLLKQPWAFRFLLIPKHRASNVKLIFCSESQNLRYSRSKDIFPRNKPDSTTCSHPFLRLCKVYLTLTFHRCSEHERLEEGHEMISLIVCGDPREGV